MQKGYRENRYWEKSKLGKRVIIKTIKRKKEKIVGVEAWKNRYFCKKGFLEKKKIRRIENQETRKRKITYNKGELEK